MHFGARLTLKIDWSVRENQSNAYQGLYERPQIFFGIFDVEIPIIQKMVCYSTRKSSKWGYARFRASLTFKMGRTGREGQ